MSQETPQQEVQMEVDARLDSTPAEGKEASDVVMTRCGGRCMCMCVRMRCLRFPVN